MSNIPDPADHLFQMIPIPFILLNDEIEVVELNPAAEYLFRTETVELRHRYGNLLHCLHTDAGAHECGSTPACNNCIAREVFTKAMEGGATYKRKYFADLKIGDEISQRVFYITAQPVMWRKKKHVMVYLEDVTELFELRDIVPICASCKKVRDDKNYWESVENYVEKQLPVNFSHGICPGCAAKLYPELDLRSVFPEGEVDAH